MIESPTCTSSVVPLSFCPTEYVCGAAGGCRTPPTAADGPKSCRSSVYPADIGSCSVVVGPVYVNFTCSSFGAGCDEEMMVSTPGNHAFIWYRNDARLIVGAPGAIVSVAT